MIEIESGNGDGLGSATASGVVLSGAVGLAVGSGVAQALVVLLVGLPLTATVAIILVVKLCHVSPDRAAEALARVIRALLKPGSQ